MKHNLPFLVRRNSVGSSGSGPLAEFGAWTQAYVNYLGFTPTGIDSIDTEESAIKVAGYETNTLFWGDFRKSVQPQEDSPTSTDVGFVRPAATQGTLAGGAEITVTGLDCDGVDSYADVAVTDVSISNPSAVSMSFIISFTIRQAQIDNTGAISYVFTIQDNSALQNANYLRFFYSGGSNRMQLFGLGGGSNKVSVTSILLGTGSDVSLNMLLHIDNGTVTIYQGSEFADRTDTYDQTDPFVPELLRLAANRSDSSGSSGGHLDGIIEKFYWYEGLTLTQAKAERDRIAAL